MITENKRTVESISITKMHHEETAQGFFVWGAGMDNDGIQRWAAHVELHADGVPGDPTKAFTECQKKIVAMFHEDPLSNGQSTQEQIRETLGHTIPTEAAREPVHGNVNMSEPPEEEEKVAEDPVEKEKVIEGARALLTHPHTEVIIKELGITKEKIHGEAQRLHGDSETWTIEIWAKYTEAIAHFHLRKGTLYDNLKPEYTDKKKGPF